MSVTLLLELFTASSCSRCGKAKNQIRELLEELNIESINYRELNVVDELDYAVSLGILTTPSIVIDGELVFSSLPAMKKLANEITQRLENNQRN